MCYFCIKLIRYTLLFWLPYYLTTHIGYTHTRAGVLASLYDAGGACGSVLVGVVSDRVGGRRMIIVGPMCALLGVLLLLYSYLNNIGFIMMSILITLMGVCVGGPDSALAAPVVTDLCEKCNADHCITSACGIVNGAGTIGTVVQGMLVSLCVKHYQWSGLFLVTSFLSFCSFFSIFSLFIAELYDYIGHTIKVTHTHTHTHTSYDNKQGKSD
eukprot:GHVR01029286.1.p1 GENE.GHVR01029286.1~~GHVR01029286.1.p1  ORF type:complete len:213 (-),score=69.54 GHVR01029286.1:309-947(-)